MKRTVFYQILILAIVVLVVVLIITTTQTNLARLGFDSNIDFLWQRAGFEISQKLIPYTADSTIFRAFLVALLNTLVLAAVAITCATMLGLFIGTARLSHNWLVSKLALAYVETFRNIPSLLQIFFWYVVALRSLPETNTSYALMDMFFLNNRGLFFPAPELSGTGVWISLAFVIGVGCAFFFRRWAARVRYSTGKTYPVFWISVLFVLGVPAVTAWVLGTAWEVPHQGRFSYEGGFVLMPEFMALAVGLSLYHATYISEIVRSGFQSVPVGQTEAAAALGLSRRRTFRLVLLPQALRTIVPPLTTVYLNIFKGTSLAAAIAYPEVVSVFVGTVNNLVGQPVFIMVMTLLIYVVFSLIIALFMNWYNHKLALQER